MRFRGFSSSSTSWNGFDKFFDGSFKRYLGQYDSCLYKSGYIKLTRDVVKEFNGRYVPEERILESWEKISAPSGNMLETEFYRKARPELKQILSEYRY